MVESENAQLSISCQCHVLSISRSRFYYVPVGESADNLTVMRLLDEQYFETPFYGLLRLQAILLRKGHLVHKRLRRLMCMVNWRTIYREPRTTIANKLHHKYPYLLHNLKVERNNQV